MCTVQLTLPASVLFYYGLVCLLIVLEKVLENKAIFKGSLKKRNMLLQGSTFLHLRLSQEEQQNTVKKKKDIMARIFINGKLV